MAKPILFFDQSQSYYELSNFAPFGFEEDGAFWPSVEPYFQAQKFFDPRHRERIRTSASPQHAKVLGRTTTIPIRTDWNEVRERVMKHALHLKFAAPKLRTLLLATKSRVLVENSPYDRYWGCGRDGRGKNRLGALLMEVRQELREKP